MRISRLMSSAGVVTATVVAAAAVLSVPTVSRAATLISDGGFEGTPVTSFVPANGVYWVPPNYAYVPGAANASASAGPWTYNDPSSGGAGLIANTGSGNPFYGSAPPAGFAGNQFAFLQSGGSFSQTFAATPGAGVISWLEANRPNFGGTRIVSGLPEWCAARVSSHISARPGRSRWSPLPQCCSPPTRCSSKVSRVLTAPSSSTR